MRISDWSSDVCSSDLGDPALLNNLCWLRGTREIQLDAVLKDCTRAVELGNNAAAVLDSRAMVFFRLGRLDEARADLDAALQLSPGMPASLYMRGIIRARGDAKVVALAALALARPQTGQTDKTHAPSGTTP